MRNDPSWKRQFASDTVAGVCPPAFDALRAANEALCATSYGDDDEFTGKARQYIANLFHREPDDCRIFFVSSGTIANALTVATVCKSFEGVACHPMSHLENDEANAPEYLSGGAKMLLTPGDLGKIDPQPLAEVLRRGHGYHSVRPRMLSVTQATELGTVYSLDELAALDEVRKDAEQSLRERDKDPSFRIVTHMDGARFANAVAAMNCNPSELIKTVDVLSFGGSKNGASPTEAVVFFDPELARDFPWRAKQTGQFTSKMRYVSSPWLGMIENDVWLENARRANRFAKMLGEHLTNHQLPPAYPVETNMVFVHLSTDQANALWKQGWEFYPFHFPDGVAYRFVCHWNTTEEAIDDLVEDVGKVVQ